MQVNLTMTVLFQMPVVIVLISRSRIPSGLGLSGEANRRLNFKLSSLLHINYIVGTYLQFILIHVVIPAFGNDA